MWEIPGTSSEIQNKQEIENFLEDVEDPDTVDFTLLTQLIQDGKMSCIFLFILSVKENSARSNSFISKRKSIIIR